MPTLVSQLAARTLEWLPRKQLSRGMGGLASRATGRRVLAGAVGLYVRAYDVDLNEADVPIDGFRTFDEFFTRRLKPGQRPIEGDARTLVSPADGRVEDAGEVRPDGRFFVKGSEYSATQLLGDASDAARFEGGRFAIVYLSPRDYHRVHAPVTGSVHTVRHVGGTLLPVNAFGLANYPGLFARNERVAIFQENAEHGEVATVMVGAIGVGRISVAFDASIMTNVGRGPTTVRYAAGERPTLERGDELGMFHLGSTAIVFVGPHADLEWTVRAGQSIRMGRALAHGVG
ncbi:MAG: archaetidylserine decarboxylase [Sandaracinaceae bacterium]